MILGQDQDREFIINRQNAKITFLQNENNSLRDDNKDLQEALKLNRDALKLAYEQNIRGQTQPKSFSSNKESTLIIRDNNQDFNQTQNINEILDKYIEENKILLKTYSRCQKERNEFATQNLLLQQINEQSQKFFKDVIHDLEEKVLELRRIIQDKEYTIQTLEKKINLPDKDGVLMKIKEIISPNEQTLPLHSELEKHKALCNSLNEKIKQYQEENQILSDLCANHKYELIKYHSLLQNPSNYYNLKQVLNSVNCDTREDHIMEFYKELYHELVSQQCMNQTDYKKTPLFSQQLMHYIPVLKSQQGNGVQSIHQLNSATKKNDQGGHFKSPRSAESRVELLGKIENLEIVHNKTKKLFFKAQKNTQTLVSELLENKTKFKQLNLQISSLIKSNNQYQKKYDETQQQSSFYKQFFQNYLLGCQSQRRNSLDLSAQNFITKQVKQNADNNNSGNNEPPKSEQTSEKLNQKAQTKLNLTGTPVEFLDFLTKDDYSGCKLNKQTVVGLAKSIQDFISRNLQSKIDMITCQQSINEVQQPRLSKQRSISDPLSYFHVSVDEKRSLIKQWKRIPQIPEKVAQIKKQQYQYAEEDYSSKQTPFFVDMSVIGVDLHSNQKNLRFNANKKTIHQTKNKQSNNKQNAKVNSSFISNEEEEEILDLN